MAIHAGAYSLKEIAIKEGLCRVFDQLYATGQFEQANADLASFIAEVEDKNLVVLKTLLAYRCNKNMSYGIYSELCAEDFRRLYDINKQFQALRK